MTSRAKAMLAIVCGLVAGSVFFMQAMDRFLVRKAPIVTGRVVARTPTTWLSIPRVDFTIRIDGSGTEVHAHSQRGAIDKIPAVVRFHYTGDPSCKVFLLEEEWSPWWLVLLFWGASLLLLLLMRSVRIRGLLGWNTSDSHRPAA